MKFTEPNLDEHLRHFYSKVGIFREGQITSQNIPNANLSLVPSPLKLI